MQPARDGRITSSPEGIPGKNSGKSRENGSQLHLFGAMIVNRSGPSGCETAIPHDPAGIWDLIRWEVQYDGFRDGSVERVG